MTVREWIWVIALFLTPVFHRTCILQSVPSALGCVNLSFCSVFTLHLIFPFPIISHYCLTFWLVILPLFLLSSNLFSMQWLPCTSGCILHLLSILRSLPVISRMGLEILNIFLPSSLATSSIVCTLPRDSLDAKCLPKARVLKAWCFWRGGRIFKRQGIMGGLWVTGAMLLKETMESWTLLLLPLAFWLWSVQFALLCLSFITCCLSTDPKATGPTGYGLEPPDIGARKPFSLYKLIITSVFYSDGKLISVTPAFLSSIPAPPGFSWKMMAVLSPLHDELVILLTLA